MACHAMCNLHFSVAYQPVKVERLSVQEKIKGDEKIMSHNLSQDSVFQVPEVVHSDSVDGEALAQHCADSFDEFSNLEAGFGQTM